MVFLLAVILLPVALAATDYDKPFKELCLNDDVITYFGSHHNNFFEDREWTVRCSRNPVGATLQRCAWTGTQNSYDRPFNFECPNNGVLTGIQSSHNNFYEDRLFKFLCCEAKDYTATKECFMGDWANSYDNDMDHKISDNSVFVGVVSEHSDKYDDRKFRFKECKLEKASNLG